MIVWNLTHFMTDVTQKFLPFFMTYDNMYIDNYYYTIDGYCNFRVISYFSAPVVKDTIGRWISPDFHAFLTF